jgi:hypothetical protein
MPVLVAINDLLQTWSTNMMPTGDGNFFLYLHGGMRKASRVVVGDTVRLTIRFDETYRNGPLHDIPDWFWTALDENPSALAHWQALSPSRQKEVLRYFAGLKSDEAKARNLVRAVHVLGGSEGHFMGRDWRDGA